MDVIDNEDSNEDRVHVVLTPDYCRFACVVVVIFAIIAAIVIIPFFIPFWVIFVVGGLF
jgi:hypothetical protein